MKTIDWNMMYKLGLIRRMNIEILHPLGLSLSRNPVTGHSECIFVSEDGIFAYSEQAIKEYKKLTAEEVKEELNNG